MYIMASEPAKGMTAAEVEAYYADKHSPQDLADAYAITHNQFWWVEDNEYDFEVGSPEHKAARMVTDEWCRLLPLCRGSIFHYCAFSEAATVKPLLRLSHRPG